MAGWALPNRVRRRETGAQPGISQNGVEDCYCYSRDLPHSEGGGDPTGATSQATWTDGDGEVFRMQRRITDAS